MLDYSELNRQRIITRLSLCNTAKDLLIARGIGENIAATDLVKQVIWLTNELEHGILDRH